MAFIHMFLHVSTNRDQSSREGQGVIADSCLGKLSTSSQRVEELDTVTGSCEEGR
jgi:hypothetical protein